MGIDSLAEAFGRTLAALGHENDRLLVLDSDRPESTGAHHFRKRHPERFVHFAAAEQTVVSAAGGLSSLGLLPVVTSRAPLCLRMADQVRLSLACAGRNVKLVAGAAGFDAGAEGGAMQIFEDIALFRAIPGMTVIVPGDPVEAALATRAMMELDGPVYMRTGSTPARRLFGSDHRFAIGRGTTMRNGTDVTIVACGAELARALDAAVLLERENVSTCVVNMATIKPLDADLLRTCAEVTGAIVTAEDHSIVGGLGSAVAECLARIQPCPIEFVGVRDRFGISGEPEALAEQFGLGPAAIAEAAKRAIARKAPHFGRSGGGGKKKASAARQRDSESRS